MARNLSVTSWPGDRRRRADPDTSLHFHARSDSEARAKPQDLFRDFGDCGIDRSLGAETGLKDVQMLQWRGS
jgi:hypothetical protein